MLVEVVCKKFSEVEKTTGSDKNSTNRSRDHREEESRVGVGYERGEGAK